MRYHHVTSGGLFLWLLSGCNSPERTLCHDKMLEAQSAVNAVESNSSDSLTRSIQLIELAESACKKAGLDAEVKQLTAARERFAGHRSLVDERDARKKAKESLTPAELDKLARDGDPNCPKGQAYKNKASGKEIRCTGVQPVEMGWAQAKKYYESRNFHSVVTHEASALTLESGGEKVVFRYREKESQEPPQCIMLYPRPGMSWQENVARNTGVSPEKLKRGGTVPLAQGQLTFSVDEQTQIAKIGDCPK